MLSLAFLSAVATGAEPSIESNAGQLAFVVPQGKPPVVQYLPAQGGSSPAPVKVATVDQLQGLATAAALADVAASIPDGGACATAEDVAKIQAQLDVRCPELGPVAAPLSVVVPPEALPGTTATYACGEGYKLSGSPTLFCGSGGAWSLPGPPTCVRADPGASAAEAVVGGCREVYAQRDKWGLQSPSQAYWIQLPDGPVRVFCEMQTVSRDGTRGWTLCGKYDRDAPGQTSRYLSNGWMRSGVSAGDMADVATFTDPRGVSSIDCRALLEGRLSGDPASYFMHAGTNDGSVPFDAAIFTNVPGEIQASSRSFFNLALDDLGTCATRGQQGGITTWVQLDGAAYWNETRTSGLLNQQSDGTLHEGGCLAGYGTMLCSFKREGGRFSNGGASGCSGSGDDSVYWAWEEDAHGCGGNGPIIGTGCDFKTLKPAGNPNPPGFPTFRFNLMLVI